MATLAHITVAATGTVTAPVYLSPLYAVNPVGYVVAPVAHVKG